MNDLRSEVEKSLKNKGCTIDSYRELAIFKSPIDINKSVDDNVKAIEEIYNSTMANDRSNGFVPFHSNTLQQPLSEEDKIKKAKAEAAEFAKNPNNFCIFVDKYPLFSSIDSSLMSKIFIYV